MSAYSFIKLLFICNILCRHSSGTPSTKLCHMDLGGSNNFLCITEGGIDFCPNGSAFPPPPPKAMLRYRLDLSKQVHLRLISDEIIFYVN